jgi:hypothetical protein
MAQQNVHLNEAELAALDVIIAVKREDPHAFNEFAYLPLTTPAITTALRLTARITPQVTRWTPQIIEFIGPAGSRDEVLKHLKAGAGEGKSLSVDDLVSIRKQAGGK